MAAVGMMAAALGPPEGRAAGAACVDLRAAPGVPAIEAACESASASASGVAREPVEDAADLVLGAKFSRSAALSAAALEVDRVERRAVAPERLLVVRSEPDRVEAARSDIGMLVVG